MFKLISGLKAVPVGQPVSLHIRYIHEGRPLARGASLRIGYNFNDGAGQCQIESPRETNHLLVKNKAKVRLKVLGAERRRSITFYPGTGVSDLYVFEIKIISGALHCGDTIDIILGAGNSFEGGFIPGKCCDSPFELFYYIDPDNHYPLCSHQPNAPGYLEYLSADGNCYPEWKSCGIKISLLPEKPVLADISLPGRIVVGEKVYLRVVIYDAFFNHLLNYEDKIELAGDKPGIQFRPISFSTGTRGYAWLPITFDQPFSPASLQFRISNLGLFQSNPVYVTPEIKRDRVFWGELHGHSSLSDGGCRGANDFFSYARNIRGLDFLLPWLTTVLGLP